MANNKGFYSLKNRIISSLWMIVVINCLEIVLCVAHIFALPVDFWNKFGVFCYLLWSISGGIASGSGIYGIEMNKLHFLEKPIQYFQYSAILKGILTLTMFISTAINRAFNTIIVYASCGPLLFVLIDEFTSDFFQLTVSFTHVLIIVFLLSIVFNLKRYRKAALKKNSINIESSDEHEEIPLQ